jgi:hypothetical protein
MSLDPLRAFAKPLVVIVTGVELYLAILLILRLDLHFALPACTVTILMFTAFLWYLTTLAHPPACGCMGLTGMFGSTKHEALLGLVRNCLLLWCLKLSMDDYKRANVKQY